MFLRYTKQLDLPTAESALTGRDTQMPVAAKHTVLGTPLRGPWPAGLEVAYFGMGCFWGAERIFWRIPGVHSTAVGYQGGFTKNPTYEETCSGNTGHTEAVQVVYDPARVSYETLLKAFWENHDPTQGMRQGNDVGTQYRSAIYTTTPAQAAVAASSREAFQPVVSKAGRGQITTEIKPAGPFYYAEDYHQQYLSDSKNPGGYCNHGPNGLTCPIGVGTLPA
ncbi:MULTISPECIES: peptide-methionine (S)-S-oxide reductase MsrA [Dactylosporangium]|uniref:Peptide methionine sulfoxide reductase MsrA n=2 Tax=Dactylosporangium TaxID=35753 RepID=A0A9W6KMN1_9ACTN|nr:MULTISPECIES: peptide-methionine (S)-S-oxide reductase MsrA [Dactylosporangium]UAB95839.1 peptide-methionine (S)-S-oxide reductase MsrA [Dactylosporangium vinaceum]UWZ44207.1 peptide-methionine (S)-S-oxide reductase MsrA [Dactylosporangium matsuzakiense]GLL03349.1 peptide methionine sulfoxide reductase MsrA 1 [Dactylosporangium matsuzakiense]